MANGQDNWNGARMVLQQGDYAAMPQSPDGSLILGYLNQSKLNNAGSLALSSGGGAPEMIEAPALIQMLGTRSGNWAGNNLRLSNISVADATPIMIQAFGPGTQGAAPVGLTINRQVVLAVTQAAQGASPAKSAMLRFTSSTGNLSVLGVVGGPATGGANAYVIAINCPDGDTGPGTGAPAPVGYYATRGGNTYDFALNWGTSYTVYVANLSPVAAATVSVMMVGL